MSSNDADPHLGVIRFIKDKFTLKTKLRILYGHWPHDIAHDEFDVFINTLELQTYVDDNDFDKETSTVELHILINRTAPDSLIMAGKIATHISDILTANALAHTEMTQVGGDEHCYHTVCWIYI